MKKQTMKKWILSLGIALTLSACSTAKAGPSVPAGPAAEAPAAAETQTVSGTQAAETPAAPAGKEEKRQDSMLQMMIEETAVKVDWEENSSVAALKELCKEGPLTIQMSMYGGFEQVGPIGRRLPSEDVQTTTASGDIVLYSGSQIVVFYGSNSWAYTKLGHISDRDAAGMKALLGNGGVTITIGMEDK